MIDASRLAGLVDRCERALNGSVVAVAADGHSAAGKSSVAGYLAEVFDVALVPGDDFYSVMDNETRAALSPVQGVDRYYDWRRMCSEAIIPLLAVMPATYRPYQWDTNALAEWTVTIASAPLVVIEGLFVARPELAHLIDITVVVEAHSTTRAARQAHRADATNDWLERWDRAERYYFEAVRPTSSFDVQISGDP